MGENADADAVALATCVQDLAWQAFGNRPWMQLAAQLSADERTLLGGGDDRRLSRHLSAQFGAKAPRGPRAGTVQAVLRHCLFVVDEHLREPKQDEVRQLFQRVNPGVSFDTVAVPRQRGGTLAAKRQRQLDDAETLRDDVARLRLDNAVLHTELKAAAVRIRALEAQLPASTKAGMATLNVAERPTPDLVRPYTRFHQQRSSSPATEDDGTDDVAASPLEPDDDVQPRRHTVASPVTAYRVANGPRIFPPRRGTAEYPADLEPFPAPLPPPFPAPFPAPFLAPFPAPFPAPLPAPLRVPRPRIVGRATVRPGVKIAPDQPPLRGAAVVWGLSAATTVLPTSGHWTARTEVDWTAGTELTDIDAVLKQIRRRARARATRLVYELRHAWVDQWADLARSSCPRPNADSRSFRCSPRRSPWPFSSVWSRFSWADAQATNRRQCAFPPPRRGSPSSSSLATGQRDTQREETPSTVVAGRTPQSGDPARSASFAERTLFHLHPSG